MQLVLNVSSKSRVAPPSCGIRHAVSARVRARLAAYAGMLVLAVTAQFAPAQGDDAATLWTQATVYRDEWGTPHVYAETPRALGFAFGHAQAEDHIEAMLMAYRTANGRAAEVVGEKMAASDEFALRMGHARLAEEALANLDGEVVELCTGFAMGVNAWLLEHQDTAPAWAEGVKPADPLALWHAFVTSMAPLDLPGIARPARAMETGNAWALAPQRTEEGKAILVINPHNYFQGPFRWFAAHLSLSGMDIAGATLFGLPLIVQGHNAALGWALTPNFPDFADVFQEDPSTPVRNPKSIQEAGNAELMEAAPMLEYLTHAQPYYVRTDEGMKERAAPAMIGPHGPIFDAAGIFYSWTIGGYGDFGAFSQLIAMATAQDLPSFQAALAMQQIPCFNITYADRVGNVFYLYNAKAGTRDVPAPEARRDGEPIANDGVNWARPRPATSFDAAWGNGLGIDVLPSVTNPGTGYVQACGGPPWACTDDAPIDIGAYPEWFIGEADTFRARRVRQLLRAGTRSFRDMQAMLFDTVVPAASEMSPLLLEMAEASKTRVTASHPDLETGLQLLRDWNYNADTSQRGMTFYHVWWSLLTAKHRDEFANETAMYDALAAKGPEAADAALGAAADAARLMRNDLNSLEIPWGDVHRIVRGTKDYPIGGAATGEPIFIASDYEYGQGKWQAGYGYGVAMAVEFGDTPESASVSAFGASENPSSPHFADQLELMLSQRLKRDRFAVQDVMRHAESALGRNVTLYPLGAEGQVTFTCAQAAACKLESEADAPAPLPPDTVAFTVFVKPSAAPVEALNELAVSLAVPEEICGDEHLGELSLYGHTPANGWQKIDGTTRDATGRVITGAPSALAVFAVLGPAGALIQPEREVPATPVPAAEPTLVTPEPNADEAPKGESTRERGAGGVLNLKLKGEYLPEAASAPQKLNETDRGVRVLRLNGDDLATGATAPGSKPKGKALWLEGLSQDVNFEAAADAASAENSNALIAPAIRNDGPQVLKLRGGYTPGVDAAQPSDAPPAPMQAPADQQTPLPGTMPVSPEGSVLPPTQPAPPAAPEAGAEPAADADQKPESRKERKRKKKEEASAAKPVQSINFTPGGYEFAPQDNSGDSFGETSADMKKSKKKRKN